MIKDIIILGGLLGSLFYFAYNYMQQGEQQYEEAHYGSGRDDRGDADEIIINPDVSPPAREDLCPICQDLLRYPDANRSRILRLACGHWLHYGCARRLLEYSPSCPVCRHQLDSSLFPEP